MRRVQRRGQPSVGGDVAGGRASGGFDGPGGLDVDMGERGGKRGYSGGCSGE